MALPTAAEDAFYLAIEAAYAIQEPNINFQDKRLAEKAYAYWMEEYYLLSREYRREQWWEAECNANPGALRCRLYDV